MRPDDVDAIVVLETAAEPVDDTGQHDSAEDLTAWFVNDLVDLQRDTRVVLDGDELVGWASAIAPPTFRDAYGVHLEGRVHPDWRGRGIGRGPPAWRPLRGRPQHAPPHPRAPAPPTAPGCTTN